MLNLSDAAKAFESAPQLLQEAHVYFSQNGEDIVVQSILREEEQKGVMVDFGAYHPFRFSNTFLLYLCGWRGINVDANESTIELFNQVRGDEINLHALLAPHEGEMEYFRFAEGAWNTTNREMAIELNSRSNQDSKIVEVKRLSSIRPNSILERYVSSAKFDFLSIDVEGLDAALLMDIDLTYFRPKVIAIEVGIAEVNEEPLADYLHKHDYELFSYLRHTAILLRRSR